MRRAITLSAGGQQHPASGTTGGEGGDGGTVTISGGTVTATGGANAAGIGGGFGGDGGDVTVTGGIVTATGSGGAAGIGTGFSGAAEGSLTVGGQKRADSGTTGSAGTDSSAPTASFSANPARPWALLDDSEPGIAVIQFFWQTTFTTHEGDTTRFVPETPESPVTQPLDPERPGYVFTGWRVSNPDGPAWDFTAPVTAHLVLVAAWEADGTEPAPFDTDADADGALADTGTDRAVLGALAAAAALIILGAATIATARRVQA